jgi:hypothetical protein
MAEFERSVISERTKAGMAAARRRGLAGSLSDFVLLIDALFPLSRFYGGCSAPQHTGRQWRMPFTDSIGRVVTKQLPPRWP